MRKGYKALLAEAEAVVETVPVEHALALHGDPGVVFVDLRDPREIQREGKIPGAFSCPRGMLEFWVDPESPYYKPVFTEDKTYILYCHADWRGVLAAATLSEMGFPKVYHLSGGYKQWREAGAPTAPRPEKKK